LSACSSLQFAYKRLDWLIAHQLDDYVSLTDHQDELLDTLLEQQLDWHRRSQLPIYAGFLQQLRRNLNTELTLADLDNYEHELRSAYATLVQQLIPDAAILLATLNEEQIIQLSEALAERNRKYQKKRVDVSTQSQREYRIKRALKQLDRWLGESTAQQQQRIEQWAAALELSSAQILVYRQQWRAAFIALLAQRKTTAFQTHLEKLMAYPEALQTPRLRAIRAHNLQLTKELVLDIAMLMNSEQRHYLDHRLQTLAEDFTQLATE